MLERVALHQTRFRTPGVRPDARGVLLGERALAVFPTLDRLVAFLRAYGEQASLDELLPGLRIERLVTPLRARELALSIQAESSHRLDRVAGVARLVGGVVLTGTARHFVAYRDARAPLGYDVGELPSVEADLVLHRPDGAQAYDVEGELSLRALLLRLAPEPAPPGDPGHHAGGPLLVTAVSGLAPPLVSYLARSGIRARVGQLAPEAPSLFDGGAGPLHLFDVPEAPPRLVRLLRGLPGVTAYRPAVRGAAVEVGHVHPVPLDAVAGPFDDGGLVLWPARGPALPFTAWPALADVRGLGEVARVREDTPAPRPVGASPVAPIAGLVPLRLAPRPDALARVTAAVVPLDRRRWLARLLYALPAPAIERLRIAVGADDVYLVDPGGLEGVPLGRGYVDAAPRVHVPLGLQLVPRVAPQVLAELVPDHRRGHVFFEPGGTPPRLVPLDAFGPVSQVAMREVLAEVVAVARAVEADPPLPVVRYGPPRVFPLRGAAPPEVPEDPAAPDDAGSPEP